MTNQRTGNQHHDWPEWRNDWDESQQLMDSGGPMAVDGTRIACRNPDCAGHVEVRVRIGPPPTFTELQRITYRSTLMAGPRPTLVFLEVHDRACPVHVDLEIAP